MILDVRVLVTHYMRLSQHVWNGLALVRLQGVADGQRVKTVNKNRFPINLVVT